MRTFLVIVATAILLSAGVFLYSRSGPTRQSFENPVAASRIAESSVGEDPVPVPETVTEETVSEPASETPSEPVPETVATPVSAVPEPVPAVRAPVIVERPVPFGHEDRTTRTIDTVIVHSSYDALGDEPYSVSGIIEEYRQYGVAAHYLIDRKGGIYRLVEDRDVAYHAGVSSVPDGRTGVNEFSIGVELVEKDTDSPTSAQYESLNGLLAYLRGKYDIRYVLGHDDIAPERKTDPWNFDWDEVE